MRPCLLILLSFCTTISLSAQIEFFVEVDPLDISFTKIEDVNELEFIQILPSMTTLNEADGHYVFAGIDNTNLNRLWSIDVTTGQTIYLPQFPQLTDPLDNVALLLADNKNGKLFALSWDDSEQEEWFVEVDPVTGAIAFISVIPDVQYLYAVPNYHTFDKINGHFIFAGLTFSGESKLWTIDSSDGSVVNSIDFPILSSPGDNVGELQYNSVDSTMYGLHWDASDSLEYLVSIDLVTGIHTPLFPIYDVFGVVGAPHFTTLDEINGHFIFKAISPDGIERLFTIDIYTGAIISSPEFPILDDPEDNLKEFKFNNANGRLYGLHWDSDWVMTADTMTMDTTMIDTTAMDTTMIDSMTYASLINSEASQLSLSPNPVFDFVQLNWTGLFDNRKWSIEIIDIEGKIRMREMAIHIDSKIMDLSLLESGIYICRLRNLSDIATETVIEKRFLKL